MFRELIIACFGGFLGTGARYLVKRYMGEIWHGSFPTGTFLVNMAGCFIIGVFLGILCNHKDSSSLSNAFIATGFCGGLTTFSSFADDVCVLGSKGEWGMMTFYLLTSVALGVFLVWTGRVCVKLCCS